MNLTSPILDVVPGPRGRVLGALVASSRPLSMRELAVQCGIAHTTASEIAAQLSAAGLATATQVGRSRIVTLNREHLAVAAILNLVDARAELVAALRRDAIELIDGSRRLLRLELVRS
jgi:DNA-binding transcriptional ArsR family regulator